MHKHTHAETGRGKINRSTTTRSKEGSRSKKLGSQVGSQQKKASGRGRKRKREAQDRTFRAFVFIRIPRSAIAKIQ